MIFKGYLPEEDRNDAEAIKAAIEGVISHIAFRKYSELVDDRDGERRLTVALPSEPITILFNAYDGVAQILDQLPTVTVRIDNGPPNAGPASGGICVFFIADGVSETQLNWNNS